MAYIKSRDISSRFHVWDIQMVTRIFFSLQQNNLSNPPTPPSSLPPTPPPVARQKMLNGFATTEELASKGGVIVGHDGEQFIARDKYILIKKCNGQWALMTKTVVFLQSPKGCFLDRCSSRLRRSCWLELWLRDLKLWMCQLLFPPHLITTRKSSGQ